MVGGFSQFTCLFVTCLVCKLQFPILCLSQTVLCELMFFSKSFVDSNPTTVIFLGYKTPTRHVPLILGPPTLPPKRVSEIL